MLKEMYNKNKSYFTEYINSPKCEKLILVDTYLTNSSYLDPNEVVKHSFKLSPLEVDNFISKQLLINAGKTKVIVNPDNQIKQVNVYSDFEKKNLSIEIYVNYDYDLRTI